MGTNITKAVELIQAAAKSGVTVFKNVVDAMLIYVEVTPIKKGETVKNRLSTMRTWAKDAIKNDAQFDTIKVYIDKASKIALAKNVKVTVETKHAKGKTSKREVSANNVSKRSELDALAKQASQTLGLARKVTRSPKTYTAPAPAPVIDAVSKSIASDKPASMDIYKCVRRSFLDDTLKKQRQAIIDALESVGFTLAKIDKSAKITEALKVNTNVPVMPATVTAEIHV